MSERRRLEKRYLNFVYHADLNIKVYLFVEFENEYKDSFKFRMIVRTVILLDSLKEKILDMMD